MPLAVSHMGNQGLRLAQLPADDFHNLNILFLVVTAYIIDLANPALVNNQVNSLAVVLYIQPITNLHTVTIYR